MNVNETLSSLHGVLAKEFLRRIEDGEATAADLSAAAKFLKDNGVDCIAEANPDIGSLAETMSFPFESDEDNVINIK